MNELRKKIESLLFASSNALSKEEIANLCMLGNRIDLVDKALEEIKERLNQDESAITLIQEGDRFKFTVKHTFVPLVSKIISQTELSKTIMETLAIIAYKAPVIQSDVIKIRTNKAYEHLSELERLGYISRTKQGRTKLIKLASKFFEYFDVPPEQLKEKFKTVAELEKNVQEIENEFLEKKENIIKMKEENKMKEEQTKSKTKKEHEHLDKEIKEKEPHVIITSEKGKEQELKEYSSVEVVGEKPFDNNPIEVDEDKVGNLDVYESSPDLNKDKIKNLKTGQSHKLGNLEVIDEPEEKIDDSKESDNSDDKKSEDTDNSDDSEETKKSEPKEETDKEDQEETNEENQEKDSEIEESEENKESQNPKKSEEKKTKQQDSKTDEKSEEDSETTEENSKQETEKDQPTKSEDNTEKRLTEEDIQEESRQQAESHKSKEGKGLFSEGMSKEVEEKINKKVGEILGENKDSSVPEMQEQNENQSN